jgi:DNA-binding response OmpR family regulator
VKEPPSQFGCHVEIQLLFKGVEMPKPITTLVVDDEEKIRLFLAETLKREGHEVTTVGSGEKALDLLQDTAFDLAILDLKLGGRIDGHRVLEAIRWRWPAMVVIILTAHGSLDSALEAIHEGIDNYLLKPVSPAQIRQAVKEAFSRREIIFDEEQNQPEQNIIQNEPFTIDLDRHEVICDGQLLDLSPSDFALLVYLIQHAPQVLGPKELVRVVRDYEPDSMYEARDIIKWYIHRLRQKVEPDPSRPRYILNVRGVGYRIAD